MDNLRKTPLFSSYSKYNAKVIDFAGWALPVQYEGIISEHQAVRNAAGVFDVSHMGEIEIKGKDAFGFVQNLVVNDISVLEDNQILYTPVCYEHGGTVDDILVYRFSNDYFYLVVNASNVDKDYKWMLDNKGNFDVQIDNISDSVCELAIQGPKAQEILQRFTDTDLSKIKFFYCDRNVNINGAKCLVSRTGYTGEDGFEIYSNSENAVMLWSTLLEKGKEDGLVPAGLGCRDTLRFEVCLPLYGNELTENISPLEAGLGYFIKLDNDNFIGKEALQKQKSEGLKRKLVGFEMKERGIPRHGYEVTVNGEKIGFVTTGYRSPSLDKNIGLALIDSKYADLGNEVCIMIRNKPSRAVIINKKFYKKNYNK